MEKDELVAECTRLLNELTKAKNKVNVLESSLEAKNTRQKNLSQQVCDTKKSNEKLKNLLNNLRDEQYISAEAAEILKVN